MSTCRSLHLTRALAACVLVCALFATATAGTAGTAATSLKLTPAVGPPTTQTKVVGSAFGPAEAVQVSFDAAVLATPNTNASGGFTAKVTIPANATPGPHAIKGVGQTSGLVASKTFTVRTDWPRFHFDATNTGYNPYENVLNASNVASTHELWTVTTGAPVESSAAVVAGVAYVGSFDGKLYAIAAATGKLKWKADTGAAISLSSPAVANGLVYVGSWTGYVYAFRTSNGSLAWSANTNGTLQSSPTVVGGTVFVTTGYYRLIAYDAATGALRWESWTGGGMYSTPAVADGLVYTGSGDGTIYAYDVTNGATVWTYPTGAGVVSSAAVRDGIVYIGSNDRNLYALDASTGGLVWKANLHSRPGFNSPAIAGDTVFMAGRDGEVFAYDTDDGDLRWSTDLNNAIVSSPVIANGLLYIGSAYTVAVLDSSTGTQVTSLWPKGLGAVWSTPTVADGKVYFGCESGKFQAFGL